MADKFDLKTFLLNIAPVIATGLGGPLAGTAVSVLSNAITGKPNTPQAELEALVSKGLNPEQLAAITQANNDFELAMKEADIDLVKVNNAHTEAYLADTQNARKVSGNNESVLKLGVVVLTAFAVVISLAMYGSYEVLTGGIIPKDPATVAAVFGFIGTLLGYVSANAQQVISFYYGSSQGSSAKTDALSDAMKHISIGKGK
jgi:hypothetical protein